MKRFILSLLALVFCLVTQAKGIDNGYVIDDWTYDAVVHENNTWDVTETMTVSYLESRHGIYRYIPRKFTKHHAVQGGDKVYTYMCKIGGLQVKGYTFITEGNGDSQENLIIRIGDEDHTVSGQHTYVITYVLRYPDDRYPAGDELFHTVLGPDCNTNIRHFAFNIRFDKAMPEGVNLHTFSGRWSGEENYLGVAPLVSSNSISGELSDIEPFNGITLQADLPEGFWVGANSVNPSRGKFYWTIFVAILLGTLLYLLLHRRKRPVMVIEYNAPDGISSAEVGVIIDDSADLSDLTSLIVWFASKGYLKIRETKTGKKDDIELVRLKDLPCSAPSYQKKFWQVFFPGNKENVLISKLGDRHEEIGEALMALSRHFTGDRSLTETHWPSLFASWGMIAAGFLTLCNSSSIESWYSSDVLFASIFWAAPLFFIILLRKNYSSYDIIKSKLWRLGQYLIILLFAALCTLIFIVFLYEEHDYLLSFEQLLCVVLGGWTVALFSGRMQRDTAYRKEQMSLLLGFREFIQKAELPMLKAQVDENPSYFYDVLPYAMVFGLSKKWQKHFKNIEMSKPDWYECSGNNSNISSLMIADRLNHNMSHAISKAVEVSSHDPNHSSSSGGGGGGYVGGGGGGGGVGSW